MKRCGKTKSFRVMVEKCIHHSAVNSIQDASKYSNFEKENLLPFQKPTFA
jgi:hypothetical protein